MQLIMMALNSMFRSALRKVPDGPSRCSGSELVFRCLVEAGTSLQVEIKDPISEEHLVPPDEDDTGPVGRGDARG